MHHREELKSACTSHVLPRQDEGRATRSSVESAAIQSQANRPSTREQVQNFFDFCQMPAIAECRQKFRNERTGGEGWGVFRWGAYTCRSRGSLGKPLTARASACMHLRLSAFPGRIHIWTPRVRKINDLWATLCGFGPLFYIQVELGLLFWQFKGGFKVSSGPAEWYRSSSDTDFENSEIASSVETVTCPGMADWDFCNHLQLCSGHFAKALWIGTHPPGASVKWGSKHTGTAKATDGDQVEPCSRSHHLCLCVLSCWDLSLYIILLRAPIARAGVQPL